MDTYFNPLLLSLLPTFQPGSGVRIFDTPAAKANRIDDTF